jgi:hypothetical protein
MARVRKLKPIARPIYPTSGKIHMAFWRFAMRIAWLELGVWKGQVWISMKWP